ncbi:MAG: hypothetical protein WEA82_04870 [Idiomarina sp.]
MKKPRLNEMSVAYLLIANFTLPGVALQEFRRLDHGRIACS